MAFGFGDLEIHGSGGQVLEINDIRDPLGVARAIGRAAADRRARAAAVAPSRAPVTPNPALSRKEARP